MLKDLLVLIPSHSLEDFPTDLAEEDAAGLLAAWQVLWHPALLAQAGALPRWERADQPPAPQAGQLVVVPTVCEYRLPSEWPGATDTSVDGGVGGPSIVRGLCERDPLLDAVLRATGTEPPAIHPDLVADFLALGFAHLQVELLSRHMRHFDTLDAGSFQREAIAGAEAVMAGDEPAARSHLRASFELLTESRAKFYPVDSYLIDLCLLAPGVDTAAVKALIADLPAANLCLPAATLESLAQSNAQVVEALRDAWENGRAEVFGGEFTEPPSVLLPLESQFWQFTHALASYRKHLGQAPAVFGRRRFGLSVHTPQLAARAGMRFVVHLALDDGVFPRLRASKIRWQSPDGTGLEALARIPLAADQARGGLQLPLRLARSMERDHVATVAFAHWPTPVAHWYDDLRRMARYSPVLGRFTTLSSYFHSTDSPGHTVELAPDEYQTPYLEQAARRGDPNPIARYADHFRARQELEATRALHALRFLLRGTEAADASALEDRLEAPLESLSEADRRAIVADLTSLSAAAARDLASLVVGTPDPAPDASVSTPGYLIFNPCSFARRVAVDLPNLAAPPPAAPPIRAVQIDDAHRAVVIDTPPMGFAWVPSASSVSATLTPDVPPMAEAHTLRNDLFEAEIDPETGGLRSIRDYRSDREHIAQRLVFHSSSSAGGWDLSQAPESAGSRMVAERISVTSPGPALGEIVSEGLILPAGAAVVGGGSGPRSMSSEASSAEPLATFRQRFRAWMGRPVLELDIEIEPRHAPQSRPWDEYYASRFAWVEGKATLTRTVGLAAHPVGESTERIESPYYLDLKAARGHVAILTGGLPFHRRHGPRMLDCILVAGGETRRAFRLGVALDLEYPMHAALDFISPVHCIPTETGPPRTACTGWFFHLDARNAVITSLQSLGEVTETVYPSFPDYSEGQYDFGYQPDAASEPHSERVRRVQVRMAETQGRAVRAKLRCPLPPVRARQTNLRGELVSDLSTSGDSVIIDLLAYEIIQLQIDFR